MGVFTFQTEALNALKLTEKLGVKLFSDLNLW